MPEQGIINGAEIETEKAQPLAKEPGAAGGGARKVSDEPSDKAERFHPLWELTIARVRETLREPEVIFWVFVFPILLVFALGIAFRNTGPQKIRVAVERSETNAQASKAAADALSRSSDLDVALLSPAEAAQELRSGKIALVVRPSVDEDAATRGHGDATNGNDAAASPRLPLSGSF